MEKKEAKVYNISGGQEYVSWINQGDSGLYYKEAGQWIKYTPESNHEFVTGEEIKVGIVYQVPQDITIYPGDKICYQMELGDSGAVLNNQSNVNVTLDGSDRVVGHFDIDGNGLITVSYDEAWLTEGGIYGRNGISTWLEASGSLKFSDSGDENGHKYIYIGDVKLEFKVKEKEKQAGINVLKDKKGNRTTDEFGNLYQTFKITINAKAANTIPINQLKIHDYFRYGEKRFAQYVEGSWNVDSKPSGLDVTVTKTTGSEKQDLYLTLDITGSGDKKGFGGDGKAETIIVSYQVKIDKSIWFANLSGSNGSYNSNTTLRNTADVTGEDVSGTGSDWEEMTFSKNWFQKTGSVVKNAEDGTAKVHYAVHINKSPMVNISGWTIKDSLQQPDTLHTYDQSSIVAIKYGANNKEIERFTPEVKTEVKDGKRYQYIEFMADGAYYYELQYDTTVTLADNQFTAGELKNKIELIAPEGSGIGNAPSYTIGVNYDVFTIEKKVLGTPDYAGRQITWQTTLRALRNGGSNGNIPQGAVYTDKLTLEKSAKSHLFDWDKLNLEIKDKDDTLLSEGEDYTLTKGSDDNSFEVLFLRDVSNPVKITYNSSADFGKGQGNDEVYKNTGTLTVQTDVKSAEAKVTYKSSNMISKQVYKGYDSNTREISWKIVVNSQQIKYDSDTKYKVVDQLPKGIKVKTVRYETASNPFHGYEFDEYGNLVIDYTGRMGEINGRTRNIIIVATVEDVSDLIGDNGEVKFTNTASLYINDKLMDTASATATAKFEVINKTAKYDKNSPYRYVEYTVNVNTVGTTLGDGNGNLTFIDQMDPTMSLAPNSLKVVNLSTGGDITSSCTLTMDTENHKFAVEIPDSTPLKISYNVNFNEYSDTVKLTNTAQLYYNSQLIDGDTNSQQFEVKQASGSAEANPDIYVYKVDGSNASKLLSGAKFNLYKLKDGGNPESTDFQNDWIFSKDLTSDANGKVSMTNLKKETYYCLIETKAPDGYVWNTSTKYIFIYADKNSEMNIPPQYHRISQNGGSFYVANNKPQLAINKEFYGGDGTQLNEGQYPDGVYYFGVFGKDGNIVNTLSGKKAFGEIRVSGGNIQNPTAGKYPLSFELEMGSYTVYETDASGNILEDTDNDGYVVINGMKFKADAQGHISIEVTVDENAYPAVAVVKNKLSPDGVQFTLRIGKELEGREMAAREFLFRIFDDKDNVVANGVNDNAGNVLFTSIPYTFESAGEHTYTIKEIKGNDPEITYSEAVFELTVSVENKNGILAIEKVLVQGENEARVVEKDDDGVYDASSNVIFKNKYEKTIIQPVTLNIKGNKVLENKNLQGEEFAFVLTGIDNESPIRLQQQDGQDYVVLDSLTVKNDADGNIQFPPMYYLADDAGKTFEYEIKEQMPAGVTPDDLIKDGVTYDATVKRLTVSVSEEDRKLVVSAKLDNEEYPLDGNGQLLTFTNTYRAEGSFHLTARKLVKGAQLIDQKFQFSVTKYKDQNDSWTEAGFKEKAGNQINTGAASRTVENNGSDIDFGYDYFELSDAGNYRYIIEEKDTSLGGYTKDTSRYAVYVKVSDKGNGILETSGQEIYKIDSQGNPVGDKLDQAEFVNTYKVSETQTELTVQKNLIGKDLTKGQFTFKLEAAENVDWTAADFDISKIRFSEVSGNAAKANDSNGLVTFEPISYEQEGMHVYKITENIPAEANESNGYKANGYTYSTEPVYVFVKVSDNGDGTLKAEKFGNPARNTYNGVITNTYEAEGEVILNGTKNLAGHKLETGQFEFTLEMAKASDETLPSEGAYKPVTNVTNGADGKFTFPAQKFAIGGADNSNDTGVYYYRIRETVPDTIPQGYTYLSDGITEHIVKVTVEEVSEGKLEITKTMADGTDVSADGVVFNNAYEAKGQWKPEAKKVLQGSPLADGQFEFELFEGSALVQTVSNKADGTITFDEITFTQDDMHSQKERELVYYVREKVPSGAEAGMVYDRTLYKIYIHLEDKENGIIEVTERIVTNVNDSEEPAEEMIFTNSFSGSASLLKTSEDGETPLGGAVFELYAANEEGGYDLQEIYTTNKEGRISVSGLAANQYYFVEKQAPDGYLIQKDAEGNPVKYGFVIGVDSGAGMVQGAVVHYENTVVNGKGSGTAALTKYDGNDQQTPLPGVQFSLYTTQGSLIAVKEDSQGNYVYSGSSTDGSISVMTTGSDGRITVAGLPWGSYYFREVQALDGYILTDTAIPFVVNADSFDSNGSPIVIEVSAVNQKTAVTIEKVDEDGAGLAGASLEIHDSETNDIVESWISDGKPHVIQGKLTVGKSYYLRELSAPSGYDTAPDQEFIVPEEGRITVKMMDRKKSSVYGNLMVTKKVSMVTPDMNVADVVVKDYTVYVGLFTDAQGQNPYGGDYVKALHIENGSSGSVTYSNLTSGTYYVFETDAQGNKIPFNEMQTDSYGSFICTVDGSGSVRIDTEGSEVSGTVALNNIYYEFPDGFDRNALIDITKKVVKNGESFTVDDTFYAGIFTLGSDGSYQLLGDMVYELVQDGTITVTVPLGGEDGQGEITYYVMETDKEGNPVNTDKEFKYHVSGEGQVTFDKDNTQGSFTITNELTEEDKKNGSLNITKKVSMVSAEDGVVDAHVKDYTIYVGLFTDEEGQHPYDTDYVKAVHIENGSSGSVSYTNLPSGTYYVFETDAKGNRIPFDELQTDSYGSFVCTVDGSGSVQIDTSGSQTNGTVGLNNIYYDFPDGFSRNAVIDISKKVLKNGQSFTADDTFYAGIFLLDADGTYELMENMLYELTQNGTISVEVPLGGEDGEGQVTYYVMETDAEGNPVSTDESFQYQVSGEGEVTLDMDHTKAALTITNEVEEQNVATPTPTPTVTSGTDTNGSAKAAVKTGDNTSVWPYLLLLAAAAGVVVILGYKRRRREN
ncbi:MAG: FctA domain-containing protein [Eubacteriales bacterium]|nr:FctA domain-containing protein [Eubacteriales bacterium]